MQDFDEGSERAALSLVYLTNRSLWLTLAFSSDSRSTYPISFMGKGGKEWQETPQVHEENIAHYWRGQ